MLRPVAHFMLIGVALFLLQRTVGTGTDHDRERIVVDAQRIEAMRRAWSADTGRAPDAREEAALVDLVIDEEVLVHTARRLGFDRTDPIVWRRLVETMRFVSPDEQPAPDVDLHAEAVRLGMDEGDLVVRRRLAERATQALRRLGRGTEPSDEELRAFVARHPDRFTEPGRVRFAQVFLGRDRHRNGLADRAAAVGRRLVGRPAAAGIDDALGDPAPFPSFAGLASEGEIAKTLGSDFATAVMHAPPGRWSGPLASPYGLHFVFVREVRPAMLRPLEATRASARYAVLREREERAVTVGLRALRDRYDVEIGAPTGDVSRPAARTVAARAALPE